MVKKLTVFEAELEALRAPDAKLTLLHNNNGGAEFYIWPRYGRVPEKTARKLLERDDIQPFDSGLFPGHPQSWKLGNWRARS